jgi:ubiquinone/menaquinone biosynthesis C-methylase UbiE
MAVPFDHIATSYDLDFTNSVIGQLQRKRVWRFLEDILPEMDGLEILELNCGTGEDAILFGDRGFNIIATDISEEMLKVTQQKVQQFSLQHKISSHYLDLEAFDETIFNKKFDLIFSNFGGLNCINPEALQKLINKIPSILTPGGRFVAVIMPRYCLWEAFYFLSKFQFKKAFRRWTKNEVPANLNGVSQKTWYYLISEIEQMFPEVERLVGSADFGRDALSKARSVLERARVAIEGRNADSIKEQVDQLGRTQRMFKGVVTRA